MSKKGSRHLCQKRKLPDLKSVYDGLCEDSIFGKWEKVSFAKTDKTPRAEKLELVHTDIWRLSLVLFLVG